MLWLKTLVLLAVANLAICDRSLTSVTTSAQATNVSIPWAPLGGKGSPPLPLNDSRIVGTGGAEQVSSLQCGDLAPTGA